jgi:acyl-homoserine lactone acylase PvdQ
VPHHGPLFPKELLPSEIRNALTFSLRWTGMDGGFKGSGLRAIFRLSMAKTPTDAEEAFDNYTGGAFNFHYATVSGHQGYHARKAIPIRGCDERPFLVMTGTGKCEWTGYVPFDRIPHVRDPERGFIVSANNDSGGGTFAGHPEKENVYIGATYDSGFRARRIDDRLTELTKRGHITRDDMIDLQADNYSGLAHRLMPYFKDAVHNNPAWFNGKSADLKAAADAMLAWDYHASSTSPVVHLFHAWFARVAFTMFDDELGEDLLGDLGSTLTQIVVRPLLAYLDATKSNLAKIEAGDAKFPSLSGHNYFDDKKVDGLQTRDELLLNAFQWAFENANTIAVERGFSANWQERPWSIWHRVNLGNDGDFAVPEMKLLSIPTDGALWTVDVADFDFLEGGQLRKNFDADNTPSNRSLFVLAKDGSQMWGAIPGGQSEHPGDEFFGDWAQTFYNNETLKGKAYYAMPFKKEDVKKAARLVEVFKAGFEGGQ